MRWLLAAVLGAAALPASAQGYYEWSFNRYVAASPLDTILTLAYGVPNSGDLQAFISCAIGANWIYAEVRLEADIEAYPDRARVPMTLSGEGFYRVVGVDIERQEEGIWGVAFALPLDDPFWNDIEGHYEIYYALPGGIETPLLIEGLLPLAGQFRHDCAGILDLVPDQAPTPGK